MSFPFGDVLHEYEPDEQSVVTPSFFTVHPAVAST
jgi:hypothetical protein